MTQRINVLILGYGEMGQAIEYLLRDTQSLAIWEKYPQANFQSVDLDEAVASADVVFFCLPVNPHREIVMQIAPKLKKDCLCVSIAKGLDETGQTAAQIFSDGLAPHQPYALLYGPMISEEIREGRYAFAQLGCKDKCSFQAVRTCFHRTRLYIEHTTDITGISWSVILKNVYAMVFGIADELQLGDNMRGYLAVAALHELDRIVRQMGGQVGSSYHLAGLGDLITTATSADSHHHELGRMLARGETVNIQGEGPHTLKMVNKFQLFDTAEFPLFRLIHQAIERQPQNILPVINKYLDQTFNS